MTTSFFDSLDADDWGQGPPPETRFLLENDKNRSLQSSEECGLDFSLPFFKGAGPNPVIPPWDRDFPYNASATPDIRDEAALFFFEVLLETVRLPGLLPDAVSKYDYYLSAQGEDQTVDLVKAMEDDPAILQTIENEVLLASLSARAMFDVNSESTFEFHSIESRNAIYPNTQNWQKTLGGFEVWSNGTAVYQPEFCQLSLEITIKIEDLYNFNRGDRDIVTLIPDAPNGRFAQLGWAKEFFTRASLTQTESVKLPCCVDEDCERETDTCECNRCVGGCLSDMDCDGTDYCCPENGECVPFQTCGVCSSVNVPACAGTVTDKTVCGMDGAVSCVCGVEVGGNLACFQYDGCFDKPTCFSVCPAGQVCIQNNCCGAQNRCFPICQNSYFE